MASRVVLSVSGEMSMTAEFTWRVTSQYCALMGWSGVLMKAELPFEYVNGPGPKFWYVPTIVDGRIAHDEHILLGGTYIGRRELTIGYVIKCTEYGKLVSYLQEAGKQLSEINKEVETVEVSVVQV